jgi:hypothetical protein
MQTNLHASIHRAPPDNTGMCLGAKRLLSYPVADRERNPRQRLSPVCWAASKLIRLAHVANNLNRHSERHTDSQDSPPTRTRFPLAPSRWDKKYLRLALAAF